jgi:hypothetical protein
MTVPTWSAWRRPDDDDGSLAERVLTTGTVVTAAVRMTTVSLVVVGVAMTLPSFGCRGLVQAEQVEERDWTPTTTRKAGRGVDVTSKYSDFNCTQLIKSLLFSSFASAFDPESRLHIVA